MRQLAAYNLTASVSGLAAAQTRHFAAVATIEKWLIDKGAEAPLKSEDFFRSKTRKDDTGIYAISRHKHNGSELTEYKLLEKSIAGLDFSTNISALCCADSITIFCSLSVSSPEEAILDTYTDARCPSVIRDLLAAHKDWTYAGNPISRAVSRAHTELEVDALVDHIKDAQSRKMPIVLVSEHRGEEAWPKFSEKLARDLLCSAEVVRITEEGSNLLSRKVGRKHSCYLGAIRLYWPATDSHTMPRSFVWTEEALLPEDESKDDIYAKRFQTRLRNLVFAATAVSVTPPKAISELQRLTAVRALDDIREDARNHVRHLESVVEDLTSKLEAAEHRNRGLMYQLQQATALAAIEPSDPSPSMDEEDVPVKGEVRFFKKVANAGKADKMVRTNDCGHSAWQSSNGAHKAKKGLARLLGAEDWKSLHHCGTCTGGGVWKVEW